MTLPWRAGRALAAPAEEICIVHIDAKELTAGL
jgi:hypothetical protein